MIGLDVGSASVKAAVIDPVTGAMLWSDYQRHETRQYEKSLDFLERIEEGFPDVPRTAWRLFSTGTGGADVGAHVGACYVQEVNALCLAVEKMHPDAQSAIELGGEDAKIVVFKPDPRTGRRKKFASMNDKCAGGTGVVIDKVSAKLGISPDALGRMRYEGIARHAIAGKCGVFAESDINGLQKQGVPPDELMASLFDSIVLQNLSVLTRGHTLRPKVLLLGGPNAFIPGMRECWRRHIPEIWAERGVAPPPDTRLEELILAPENALLFGALGAVEFGKSEVEDNPDLGLYHGTEGLRRYIETRRTARGRHGSVGPVEEQCAPSAALTGPAGNEVELAAFRARYMPARGANRWRPMRYPPGSVIEAFLGVDGGSTSAKAVLLDADAQVIAKAYQLCKGNPIEDTREVCAALYRRIVEQACDLRVLGVAVTGYAKDILHDVIGADVSLVETVAHMQGGLHAYPRADVICDVGGQDIKIIFLKNGVVKDFRLNTQCSAGNGYYLQATAAAFGYRLEEYADVAFAAKVMPHFGHGCVVFLQSDIVDFQRQGWQPHEIMAGLADVLPRNIWLYVCQIPDLPRVGKTFVLQGGTQHNLAAVKAQVDYIRGRFKASGIAPEIVVHAHCGESGAIGAALEALRLYEERGYQTRFIGFDALESLTYHTARDERTRCSFCANRCERTFLEVRSTGKIGADAGRLSPFLPLTRRIILANCEKGRAANIEDLREISRRIEATKDANPNLVERAARAAFEPAPAGKLLIAGRPVFQNPKSKIRIGMPRVMNLYGCAPFFAAYFASLGVPPENIVWSDYTSEALYKEGARRGSIDPCYPSKLAIPHVHNLLVHHHTPDAPLTHIFFPSISALPTWLRGVVASRTCPGGAATPESTYAAFVKETDVFAEHGICFKRTVCDLSRPAVCARQLQADWADAIGAGEAEWRRAVRDGLRALEDYQAERRREARAVLAALEREGRLAIVILGRPYHNDPGINHGICEEFQKLGYPILTHDSLPLDDDILDELFGAEVAAGEVASPLHIDDVWKNSYAENSSRKLWAAKFVARHPCLVALELSNFKCGHDAPIYTVVEEIIESAGKPFFHFKDLDENPPGCGASIKIRVQTIAYFLERYSRRMISRERLSNLGRAE